MKGHAKYVLGALGIFIAGGIFTAAIFSLANPKSTEANLKDDIYRVAGEVTTASAPETAAQTTNAPQSVEQNQMLSVTAKTANTWAEGDKTVQEIKLDITNSSGNDIDGWKCSMEFDTPIISMNTWNDTYTSDGAKLEISPVEWNTLIKAGETKTINFQMKTAVPAQVKKAVVKTASGINAEMQENTVPQANAEPPVSDGKSPFEQHGKLSVKGTQLVDSKGNNFIIQGVSTHGIAWFPQYVDKEGFKTLRDTMGVNTVRLALYSSANENYNASWHDKVAEGVNYAKELGMYVIIDWHILGNGNPNTDKENAKKFFTDMTTRFKNYDNVIYEICNEPNGNGVTWENTVKPYAVEMVHWIRQQDNDAVIIVGTPTWSQDVDIVANSPITGESNLIYALHFYASTHKADLRNKLEAAYNKGLPIIVSEFGISAADGNGSIDETEGTTWINYLRGKGIGYCCWSLCNKNEACSILNSNCNKTSGWTDEDLSPSGKWLKRTYTN